MQHTYILYNTAAGTYPGDSRRMTVDEMRSANAIERECGSQLRWVSLPCDSCDTARNVELLDGTALCAACR